MLSRGNTAVSIRVYVRALPERVHFFLRLFRPSFFPLLLYSNQTSAAPPRASVTRDRSVYGQRYRRHDGIIINNNNNSRVRRNSRVWRPSRCPFVKNNYGSRTVAGTRWRASLPGPSGRENERSLFLPRFPGADYLVVVANRTAAGCLSP